MKTPRFFPQAFRSAPEPLGASQPFLVSGYNRRKLPDKQPPPRESRLEDFVQIALLAHSLFLLRGGEKGREPSYWQEAAEFWRKQLSDPMSAQPRCRTWQLSQVQ